MIRHLPFLGSKSYYIKKYKEALAEFKRAGVISENLVFLDLFGGSGVLSCITKEMFPKNQVVWNDYDNFQARLNLIPTTNQILQEIQEIQEIQEKDRLQESVKQKILSILRKYDEEQIDYITLSASLLFAGTYARNLKELENKIFYNRIAKTSYKKPNFSEITRVSGDFLDILEQFKKEQVFLLLDPPYLQTIAGNYRSHFTLKQFLALMERIKRPFIIFGSEKSDILEFIEWFKQYNTELENTHIIYRNLVLGKDREFLILSQIPRLL